MQFDGGGTQKKADDFVASCRRCGVKATPQRTEILRELAGSREHPDAATVHGRVKRRMPAISLDTVYRTLRMFEEKGVVTRVGFASDKSRFDGNTAPHHHFVCSKCGFIGDIHGDLLAGFSVPPEVERMGEVNAVRLELHGLCKKCRRPRR